MDTGLSRAAVRTRHNSGHSFALIGLSSDIPLPLVTSGCENSGNLRELALNRMKDFGAECRDVRFREVGVRHILARYIRSRQSFSSSNHSHIASYGSP